MQLNKIDFLDGISNIEVIDKGYSGASKYLFIKGNKKYFLKIGKFEIVKDLEQIFVSNEISHPTIIDSGKYDDDLNYIIEKYIEGKDLKEELDSYDSKFIYEYGFEMGAQYRKLRSIYPDKPMTNEKYEEYLSNVYERVKDLKSLIQNNDKINFNDRKFLDYIITYLNKNINLIKNSRLVFGHTDIKPSNYLLSNKTIIATDIEHTDYKELSLSMLWTFARCDYKDEKNLAFARGYLDGLYNFCVPCTVLDCFNYTYLFSMAQHCIKYIKKDKYNELSKFIQFVNENYMINHELKISEKLKSILNIDDIELLKDSNITLVKGSYSPNNLTFKCQNKSKTYFLKIMKMSQEHYKKALESYSLLGRCGIPISPIIDNHCILKNKYYYTISKFVELNEMDESIGTAFQDGFKNGELVASYLIKLKGNHLKNAGIHDKNYLLENIKKDINKIYGKSEHSDYIHWSKKDINIYVDKYIKSFEKEPIDLIHGDVKFGNLLYGDNEIYFTDNESLVFSYDIMNFMYNIHEGFLEEENLCYKGFVNGYLKYMNNGVIPYRIQNQVRLLLIYYVLRTIKDIIDNKSDESRLKYVIKGCKYYIDEDKTIEWLS